ncbi:trehalose-phosphatase [Candidatus Margulisiibacteriota bacterium]
MKYLLFLDYDGTLTPIVSKPSLANLSAARKKSLQQLARSPDIRIAIVSGRLLADVRKKVGIPNIFYAGNHGFEISGPGTNIIHPKARTAKPVMRKIKKELATRLKSIKGVIVEDKVLTLSLHYRLVRKQDLKKVARIFFRTVEPYLHAKKIRITSGKKVFEVRPNVAWDKGKAVLWLMKKLGQGKKFTPVYIGDDRTDEDAFQVLKKRGLSVRVGRTKKTCARRQLKDVNAVYRFLGRIFEQL